MSRNRAEDFGPYQDALRLFDHVVEDMANLRNDPHCYRLIGQQVGSADSICANMDEGFGRLSRTELIRFLDIARGSARETPGRYKRLKHWLPPDLIENRVALADRIIAKLTTSISTLKANNPAPGTPGGSLRVREPHSLYGASEGTDPDITREDEIQELLRVNSRDMRHATRNPRHPSMMADE